ncbi:MAG: Mov34/MPN/PAD-1 family protein [archaeon]|jgi:proteasome lid subunit RPN8/RPN11
MWSIKKSVLLNALKSAENYYPDEFMCFLGGQKKENIIDEIVFLPTSTTIDSATINETIIPFDESILGSLHSHPNGYATPSLADKKFFTKYNLNLIFGYPFTLTNINFFNAKSEKIKINLIED